MSTSYGQLPATIGGDFPDPTVIYAEGKYYAIGTSSEWGPHFPIYSSKDLVEWEQTGFVFSSAPQWTQSSFWAPEYFYHNGIYYVYYSAKRKSDGVSCIGVATSRYPDRDFVDHGVVVDYGTESIDAFVVREGDDLYMTWKAYGLDQRPIELVGSKMSPDGLRLEGEVFSLLQDTAHVGVEGQSFLKYNDYYYMFYSAGNCCGVQCDYHVKAVKSKSLKGPYMHVGESILLGENPDWKCMGHGTFVQGKDDKTYYLFHGYNQIGTTYTGREGLLAELVWSTDEIPSLRFMPAVRRIDEANIQVDFVDGNKIQPYWQWDYRYSKPYFSYGQDGLELSGDIFSGNATGTVLTLRPQSTDYVVGGKIDLMNSSHHAQKGVVIYGDKDQAIGIGVQGNKIQFWISKQEGKINLAEEVLPTGVKSIELQLELQHNLQCKAYYKIGQEWIEIVPEILSQANVGGISPWDRSPRPGLHFYGEQEEKAVFQHFFLTYRTD